MLTKCACSMKTIWLSAIGSLAIALQSPAQTNLIPVQVNFTNGVIHRYKEAVAARYAAVIDLNKHFEIDRDLVENRTTFRLKDRPEASGIQIDLICRVAKGETAPSDVAFHFSSRSRDWRFLRYSRFAINYDGKTKAFDELEVTGDVLSWGVSEQMFAHIPYEEFRIMAFSKSVGFKLGAVLENMTFTWEGREPWRSLIRYFESEKKEKEIIAEAKSLKIQLPPYIPPAIPQKPIVKQAPTTTPNDRYADRYGQKPK